MPTSDGKWAVEAFLLPPDWTNVSVDLNEDNRDILCGSGKTVTIPVLSPYP